MPCAIAFPRQGSIAVVGIHAGVYLPHSCMLATRKHPHQLDTYHPGIRSPMHYLPTHISVLYVRLLRPCHQEQPGYSRKFVWSSRQVQQDLLLYINHCILPLVHTSRDVEGSFFLGWIVCVRRPIHGMHSISSHSLECPNCCASSRGKHRIMAVRTRVGETRWGWRRRRKRRWRWVGGHIISLSWGYPQSILHGES